MARPRAERNTTRLPSLTGLRFYAALAVLLRHAVPALLPIPIVDHLVDVGPVGVGFFFALSGFVLAWSYDPALPTATFYWRRLARIYPLHLLTTVLMVALSAVLMLPLYWGHAAISLLLIQSWLPETFRTGGNSVSWSLSCELFFYACFPFLIRPLWQLSSRHVTAAAAAVYLAMGCYIAGYVVLTAVMHSHLTAISPYTNPAYRIGEFAIGILVARFVQQGSTIRLSLNGALLLSCGALLVLGVADHVAITMKHQEVPPFVMDWLVLPFVAALLVAAAQADLGGRHSALASRTHVLLGQWSFALYLIQFLVILPVVAVVQPSAGPFERLVLLAVVLAGSIVLSGLFFHFFEVPCERWLRRRRGSPGVGVGADSAPLDDRLATMPSVGEEISSR